mgnify:CR=1 FL=1
MHHPKIKIGFGIRIGLLKHPNKIIPYLTQFEEFLYLIFFSHDCSDLRPQPIKDGISLFFGQVKLRYARQENHKFH